MLYLRGRYEVVVCHVAAMIDVVTLLRPCLIVQVVLVAVAAVWIVRIRKIACDGLLGHLRSHGLLRTKRVTLLELSLLV